MTYVGIDVSKATFVVAYSSAKGSETKTFKNTVKGIREFIQTISPKENHCVLEATGNYSMLLVYLLSKAGFVVSMENPLKIKNFARVIVYQFLLLSLHKITTSGCGIRPTTH